MLNDYLAITTKCMWVFWIVYIFLIIKIINTCKERILNFRTISLTY